MLDRTNNKKTKPVPLEEVNRDLSLCHGTSHIPTMEAFPCAMVQALYHDGACTCSTCANLYHQVGLQGREKFAVELYDLNRFFAIFCEFVPKKFDNGKRLEMTWNMYPFDMSSCVYGFPFQYSGEGKTKKSGTE